MCENEVYSFKVLYVGLHQVKMKRSEYEKENESEKYEKVKVKVMPTHSEFCMLACTSTFSHSSFVSFPSVSLLTALGFFLTFSFATF